MKNLFTCSVLFLSLIIGITSCSNDNEPLNQKSENTVETHSKDNGVLILLNYIKTQNMSAEDAANFVENNWLYSLDNKRTTLTRADIQIPEVDERAYKVLEDLQEVSPYNLTIDEYSIELHKTLDSSLLLKESREYQILEKAIYVTTLVLQMKSEENQMTRYSWDDFRNDAAYALKCAAGTIGSAGLGGLSGAGVGAVTIPVIGAVPGVTLGLVSGALVGAASFC